MNTSDNASVSQSLSHVKIVMVNTTLPANIGSALRAMKTMGLSKLVLVKPKTYPHPDIDALAAGAQDLIDQIEIVDTLEEAIDAAREEFLADNPGIEEDDANIEQLNIQKYVMQDGDIMWQAEFFADDGEDGECLPVLSGEAAQAVFDGDYDEIELRQEWLEENTLHEWDEGEFQLEPPLDTEEGQTAADEWDER